MSNLLNKVTAKEKSISIAGYDFLCIFGVHINGGYLAIPNWNICIELSDNASDFAYNSDQIYTVIKQIEDIYVYNYELIADTLADEIRKEGY